MISTRLNMRVHRNLLRCIPRLYIGKNLIADGRGLHRSHTCLNVSKESNEAVSDVPNLASFPLDRIRNFSIIAHVDHGKSTLADRILELTGAIKKNTDNKQVLDKLQVERERGITVKAQTASIFYEYSGQNYLLNLIDTPGHVDFTYEVSRSLAACQGAILLVDANEGVQAQTVANFYLAFTNEIAIIPVLNKIDLKNANPARVKEQLMNLFEIDPDEVLLGVVCLILVVDGTLKKGDHVTSSHSGKSYEVKDLGILTPRETTVPQLFTGQVGYFTANIRSAKEAQVGDTFHLKGAVCKPLQGFKAAKPMVFGGVYPMDQRDHPALRAAIERLCLNDGSVSVSVESSSALGQGWRLGFLGLLHMDVFNQRLEQEHGAQVITTTPSVPYKIKVHGTRVIREYGGEEIIITNPSLWPDKSHIAETSEPFVLGTIISPDAYMGAIMGLCQGRRGVQHSMKNLDHSRVVMQYKLPLNEIVVDFYDTLKSLSSGYATFDYEDLGFELSHLVKLDILLNGHVIQELSTIVHISQARTMGKHICEKLRETLPKQLFQIAIQAAVGGEILARTNIKAMRKDVLAKCYGGDISRKMKLLKRQAEGKKRMKMYGNIEIPRETFINILKR
ncbi:translation factor GUF1, mitochondrial-like isoform X2 [Homarus americanus]|uniref:translation factor GUF1, mitochondrial-like isoform X2 n=1 Tax=Homarus americanus TaxID=6706 RepID=UPI001C494DB4|nr:translation factor GUF1, mitochondrial-like isoform X2 [Homarus americanus]